MPNPNATKLIDSADVQVGFNPQAIKFTGDFALSELDGVVTISVLAGSYGALTNGKIWVGDAFGQAIAVTPSGDATMTNAGVFTVTKIDGVVVDSTATDANMLLADGTQWNSVAMSGDATIDNAGVMTVTQIDGVVVDSTPTDAQMLIADGSAWNSVALSGDATIDNAGVMTVSGINGTPVVSVSVIDKIYTTTGGAATENLSAGVYATVLATDRVYVQLTNDGTNNVSVKSAKCNAGSVDIVFSGDPANDTIVNILITRDA